MEVRLGDEQVFKPGLHQLVACCVTPTDCPTQRTCPFLRKDAATMSRMNKSFDYRRLDMVLVIVAGARKCEM
jgi:hypothetical protein